MFLPSSHKAPVGWAGSVTGHDISKPVAVGAGEGWGVWKWFKGHMIGHCGLEGRRWCLRG